MSSDGVISESEGRDGVGSGNVAFNLLSGNLPEGNDANDERHQLRQLGLRAEIHSRDLPKTKQQFYQLSHKVHCIMPHMYMSFFFRDHGLAA